MRGPVHVAASISTSAVASPTSLRWPPMIPASEVGPASSAVTMARSSRVRSCPSRVVKRSPSFASRTMRCFPATWSQSKKCSGWPSSSMAKFEMSTTLLSGRCPASASRTRIQAGAGRIRTPLTRWNTNRLQSSVSIVTRASSVSPSYCTWLDGSRNGTPNDAASSRARPTIESASGRLGVTSTSRTGSVRRKCAMKSVPTVIVGSSCMIPSSNHAPGRATSSAEMSMPCESMPRIFRGAMVSPPASCAPMRATGTVWPAATLVAAVAMSSVAPAPTSRVQSCRRSALGCGSSVAMRPTTTLVSAGRVSTSSTGNPSVASRATVSSGLCGKST